MDKPTETLLLECMDKVRRLERIERAARHVLYEISLEYNPAHPMYMRLTAWAHTLQSALDNTPED